MLYYTEKIILKIKYKAAKLKSFLMFKLARLNKAKADLHYIHEKEMKIYQNNFPANNKNHEDFMTPSWKDNCDKMEEYLTNNFSSNFLNYKIIRNSMVLNNRNIKNNELKYIETKIDQEILKEILREYDTGTPRIMDLKYNTSATSIHHLYHLIKFSSELKIDLNKINTVVEFGGGYGDLAKIFKKINPKITYLIIDLPIFSTLQSIYLKSVLGEAEVNLIIKNEQMKNNAINLIPLDPPRIDVSQFPAIDLFVSTWALSESSLKAQQYIKSKNYFDAENLLLAYQKNDDLFSCAENIKNINKGYASLYNKEIEFIKDNYYLFCEKINI